MHISCQLHGYILQARCDCLMSIFAMGIHRISLQNYCRRCQICLVYEIFFTQLFQPMNVPKGTSINTVTKWQNDLALIWIRCSKEGLNEHNMLCDYELYSVHVYLWGWFWNHKMSLTYLKFCSLPLTTAKLEGVRIATSRWNDLGCFWLRIEKIEFEPWHM